MFSPNVEKITSDGPMYRSDQGPHHDLSELGVDDGLHRSLVDEELGLLEQLLEGLAVAESLAQ